MSNFALNVPLNELSFGNVSIAILREFFKKGILPHLFPIGPVNLAAQKEDPAFNVKVQTCMNAAMASHSRKTPILKLWHLSGALESFSNEQTLLTFYELDSPTKEEINACRNQKHVIVTSQYSKHVLEDVGISNVSYVPLGFDKHNFNRIEKKFWEDDRIVFNLVGKFEKRKHHAKIIQAWIKKYGNNPKYMLQCAIFNPFLTQEQNQALINQTLQGQRVGNINLLGPMPQNELYNHFLNSAHIIIAMSGAEGFGLPEFHSIALGKHAVALNAHAYKTYVNADNAVLVSPTGKAPIYDGIFFHQGAQWNQGNFFQFDDDEFIAAMETCVERFRKNPINEHGLKLQNEFTYENTANKILELVNEKF